MENATITLRPSDFVILTGFAKKDGRPYKFAKIDSSCALMNDPKFLEVLTAHGVRTVNLAETAGAQQAAGAVQPTLVA
jgi:hypothetical protein